MNQQVTTIIALIVGGVIGWAFAKLLRHKGFSALSFTIVGIVGGVLGYLLWGMFHTADGLDLYYHTLASSAAGGIVLVLVWRLMR